MKLEKMKSLYLVLFLAFGSYTLAAQVRFDNYKVFSVTPKNEEQVKVLQDMEEHAGYSFWNDIGGVEKPVHIMVPPHLEHDFHDVMNMRNMEREMLMDDVQKVIDRSSLRTVASQGFDFLNYHTLEDIQQYLRDLASRFPDNVEVIKGGESYEGRDVLGIRISFSKDNSKRGVLLEGGIHAREWISPATVLYIATEVLTSSDPDVRNMATSHDWYIFPNFNPDGYVYTHTTNRVWRKTRKPYGNCFGTDPNRNWGYHWMEGGASSNPCSDTFAGSSAFSDVETASISKYISSINANLIAYIGFHSYSQLLLIPYGHSSAHVENYDDLKRVGDKAAKSLASRYGTKYTVGNIVETIYIASGSSMDWVKGNYHTPITYTYELRDTGRYGFLLPPEQIIPTGEETLDSLVTILSEFKNIIK